MKKKNPLLPSTKIPFGLMLALTMAGQTACGSKDNSSKDSHSNEAVKESMKRYYNWVYADTSESHDKLKRINTVELYIKSNDIFRLTEKDLSHYFTLCEKEGVPKDVCQDLMEIHKFYQTQEEEKKSHKEKCHGLTCGVTAL